MGRLKPDTRNLSQGEADTIVSIVKKCWMSLLV